MFCQPISIGMGRVEMTWEILAQFKTHFLISSSHSARPSYTMIDKDNIRGRKTGQLRGKCYTSVNNELRRGINTPGALLMHTVSLFYSSPASTTLADTETHSSGTFPLTHPDT